MARSYTADGKTYQGFDRKFSPASEVQHVALIRVEDVTECYVIENPQKVSGFVNFVAEELPGATLLGIYSRK